MTYSEAVDYIEGIGRFSVKNSNEHTRECLARLGHPDRKLLQIHAAGTNGKGSTCAYLSEILKKSGRKTALFTSPHLVTIRERMKIDGENISEERFLEVFLEVKRMCGTLEKEGLPTPSYFEFLFLMAELYFAEEGADAAVIETGLGGRLDATNSIERPVISIITSISFDHMQYLGTTIPEIASEKAGIIKSGVPVVYDASREDAAEVIWREAARRGSPAYELDPSSVRITGRRDGEIDFSIPFRYDGRALFTIRSDALYQTENAALALLALRVLAESDTRFADISAETAAEGLYDMRWPGRMERLAPRVYLDGGHNVDGIRRFTESARALVEQHSDGADTAKDAGTVLLFAVVSDKDYTDMIRLLAEGMNWSEVIVTEAGGARRTDPEGLTELFRKNNVLNVRAIPDFREAFREALNSQGAGWLFISGSLYLAGEVEELLGQRKTG